MWKEKGFSLLEWLIIIAYLVVMGAFVWNLANPLDTYHASLDLQRKNDLKKIKAGMEIYYAKFNMYPMSTDSTTHQPYHVHGLSPDDVAVDWGDPWTPFMDILPKDPDSKKNYVYYSTGQAYYLYVSLDRGGKDPDACHRDGSSCDNVPQDASCGAKAICNYGVSSPNVYP